MDQFFRPTPTCLRPLLPTQRLTANLYVLPIVVNGFWPFWQSSLYFSPATWSPFECAQHGRKQLTCLLQCVPCTAPPRPGVPDVFFGDSLPKATAVVSPSSQAARLSAKDGLFGLFLDKASSREGPHSFALRKAPSIRGRVRGTKLRVDKSPRQRLRRPTASLKALTAVAGLSACCMRRRLCRVGWPVMLTSEGLCTYSVCPIRLTQIVYSMIR